MPEGKRVVTFHLRPHLAQFAGTMNGQPPVDFGDPRDTISAYARSCLLRTPPTSEVRRLLREWATGRQPYTFHLSFDQGKRYGRFVDLDCAMRFEKLVDNLLVQLLRQHLASTAGTGRVVDRIEAFMTHYRMDPMHIDAQTMSWRVWHLTNRLKKKNSAFPQ